MLMRAVPPHVSRWPGDVCLCSCGFPDNGIFSADPILLSLPLGIWSSLSSSPVVVICDRLHFLIYGARLLLIAGQSALSLSQRQPLTPSTPHSCLPEESAPPAHPKNITSPSLCSWFKHWDFATSTPGTYQMLNQQLAKYILSRSAILSLFCSYTKSVIWPVSVLLEEVLNMFVLLWQFCHWSISAQWFFFCDPPSTACSFSYKNWERREKDLSEEVNKEYEAIDVQQKGETQL